MPTTETIVDLVKLIPNSASVIAVIAVVYLFLKQQDKTSELLQDVIKRFNEESASSQKAFQENITSLADRYFIYQKAFQDQTQSISDAHIKISEQTITAVRSLESSIKIIQERVRVPN